MKEKINKTNVARLLDKAKVKYELVSYEVDENDLSATYFVCVVPGGEEVDLKKAAKASGNKSCAMIHVKELLPLTGYIRGGCSPIGMKKHFPTYVHESALEFEQMYVSAGQRGLQIRLAPSDLIREAQAQTADLV